MLFSDVLARFDDVAEHADGGWIARCPAHDDSRPSLRIWRGDDFKVRVHCQAQCSGDQVRAAAGLRWRDMFESTGPGGTVPSGPVPLVGPGPVAALAQYIDRTTMAYVANYDSPDAAAARAYAEARFGLDVDAAAEQCIGVSGGRADAEMPYVTRAFERYPRLTVPLHGFDGIARGLQGRDLSGECPGRWVSLSNPPDARWLPYGVFRGGGGYGTILVTEGPGDALTVVSVGYDAVAIRGASLAGSAELIAELAEGLRGSLVILAGDQDSAGNGFTRRLAAGLAEHGIHALVLGLPPSVGDLTAWRESNPSDFPAALHSAVRAARPARDAAEVAAERGRAEVTARTGAELITADQSADALHVLAGLIDQYGESDAMHAHALYAWTGGRIRHATGLGFFVWTGKVWERSPARVRQEVHRMGAALLSAGESQTAKSFLTTGRIDAMLKELQSVPSVHVDAMDFDCRPHLLSFRNGTVNLSTGEMHPHDPADMITYSLGIDYDPAAQCPRWESFLSEIFRDSPDLVDYMRRMVGYGISGSTDEQAFCILWGQGANGKSVFTDTLTEVFRAITKTTPFATFEARPASGIPNDIAALRSARLVMASEGESGAAMSESVIKRMTGKDEVSARYLRQEFFTFKPAFLLMLASNFKPAFRGQDEGLWRRIKLIPFSRYFAPEERDYDLDKKLLAEAPGIAAWAVRGAREWYAAGLRDPQVITRASADYRATSDQLAGFYPGVLEPAEDGREMLGNAAFLTYLEWCEAENLPERERWTRRVFYSAMEERGVSRRKTKQGITLIGIRDANASPLEQGPGIFA